jgi:hypothetical protein
MNRATMLWGNHRAGIDPPMSPSAGRRRGIDKGARRLRSFARCMIKHYNI